MTTFGQAVTYQPISGDSFSVNGVFSAPHLLINQGKPEEGPEMSTSEPTLGIRLAYFELEPVQGDIVIINSIIYLVIDPQKDGQGGAKLILQRR